MYSVTTIFGTCMEFSSILKVYKTSSSYQLLLLSTEKLSCRIIVPQHIHIQQTLLGFVSKTTCLIRSSRARSAVNRCQLSVLPNTDSQQKAHHIALLLPIQLLDVLVCTHVVCLPENTTVTISSAKQQHETVTALKNIGTH